MMVHSTLTDALLSARHSAKNFFIFLKNFAECPSVWHSVKKKKFEKFFVERSPLWRSAKNFFF
jgi:hypothetical protein